MKVLLTLLLLLVVGLAIIGINTHVNRETRDTAEPTSTSKLTPDENHRLHALRDKALHHTGWVAGNAYTSPIWNELEGLVGERGTYFKQLTRIGDSASDYYANKRIYDEAFERGREHPPNVQECTRLAKEVRDLIDQMNDVLGDAKARIARAEIAKRKPVQPEPVTMPIAAPSTPAATEQISEEQWNSMTKEEQDAYFHAHKKSVRKGFDDYSVNVQESGELLVCEVRFNSLPPTSDIAAEVVRNALEVEVKRDDSRKILAMAFNASGEALPDTHYGGPLTYNPSDGQILTIDERNGLQAKEGDEGTYYVRVEDSRTARGITPIRKWYNVSIVFPSKPSVKVIKAAVLSQIEKLKQRGLDINVYIYKGDKSNKVTWKQLEAPNGKFMAIDYLARTGEVSPNWNWE